MRSCTSPLPSETKHSAASRSRSGASAASWMRGLQRDEREVEALVELAPGRHRLDHDAALLAELVEPQPLAAQALDVLAVGVEHDDAAHARRSAWRR